MGVPPKGLLEGKTLAMNKVLPRTRKYFIFCFIFFYYVYFLVCGITKQF